jgi:hypothetical protein
VLTKKNDRRPVPSGERQNGDAQPHFPALGGNYCAASRKGLHRRLVWRPQAGRQGQAPSGRQHRRPLTTYTNAIGAGMLLGTSTNPDFNPEQGALYYARAPEIPSPLWSTHDAVRNGLPLFADVPATTQERAWGSPAWYWPEGRRLMSFRISALVVPGFVPHSSLRAVPPGRSLVQLAEHEVQRQLVCTAWIGGVDIRGIGVFLDPAETELSWSRRRSRCRRCSHRADI